MEYSHLLERANLFFLETYLREGSGASISPPEGSYQQRIAEAEKKIEDFFASKFDDPRELDELRSSFYTLTWVYEDIYFEIGLLAGARLSRQIDGRLKELAGGGESPL